MRINNFFFASIQQIPAAVGGLSSLICYGRGRGEQRRHKA